jgi:hypothetical protein
MRATLPVGYGIPRKVLDAFMEDGLVKGLLQRLRKDGREVGEAGEVRGRASENIGPGLCAGG